MVLRPAGERASVAPVDKEFRPRRHGARLALVLAILFVVAVGVAFGANALIVYLRQPDEVVEEWGDIPAEDAEPEEEVAEPELPAPVEGLTGIVEAWAAGLSGNKSVLIYDVDRDEMVVDYNVNEDYNSASLYKLFVVYEGYKRVQNGVWDGATVIVNGRTILECLDLAIRESNSSCAETLWAMIGRETLDGIIANEWGITNSRISSLTTNAEDIYKIMRRFYEHPDLTDEALLTRMWDSFLNQPVTEYNWRQGLPSGFSDNAEVYNKVGWAYNPDLRRWDIYHDAAIVHFKNSDRTFIIIVMTNYVDFTQIRNLAAQLETILSI